MISSEGLGILEEIGVVRRHRRVRSGSFPSSFALMSAFFTVCTCLSMKPFDFGWMGEEVMWSKHHSLANSLNCLAENCGPLSDLRTLGMPCSANIYFIIAMVVLQV